MASKVGGALITKFHDASTFSPCISSSSSQYNSTPKLHRPTSVSAASNLMRRHQPSAAFSITSGPHRVVIWGNSNRRRLTCHVSPGHPGEQRLPSQSQTSLVTRHQQPTCHWLFSTLTSWPSFMQATQLSLFRNGEVKSSLLKVKCPHHLAAASIRCPKEYIFGSTQCPFLFGSEQKLAWEYTELFMNDTR